MIKPLTEEDAVSLAKQIGSSRLVILAADDDGNWSYATAGRTDDDAEGAAAWADRRAEAVIMEMMDVA